VEITEKEIFASKVKALRLVAKRSTSETAKLLDIEPAYYSTIESGKRFPGKKTIRNIKALYHIEDDAELYTINDNVKRLVDELSKHSLADLYTAYSVLLNQHSPK
jgi:transcriptional regulator with XRE-family HTH domain